MAIHIPESLAPIVPYNPEVKIPRIIHQTYKSLAQLPAVWKDTPDKWQEYHPAWTYCFWSDEACRALVKEKFAWFLSTYDGYEYAIQRADAIRPMMLYVHGGLYADCDIQPIKPFDDLFYNESDLYLALTPNNNVVTNCLMASKPGVKFWERVLREMEYRAQNPSSLWIGKHWLVMYTTGPMMLNAVFEQYKDSLKVELLPRELILPSECSTCVAKPCSTKLGYTKLLEGSSWINYDTRCYNWMMCNYGKMLVLFALGFLLYHIYYYFTGSSVLVG